MSADESRAVIHLGPDAKLHVAERKMRRLLAEGERLAEPEAAVAKRFEEIGRCFEIINTTPPTTLAGVAVKLRLLADPDIGMECGEREDDFCSLRQALEFVERSIAAD